MTIREISRILKNNSLLTVMFFLISTSPAPFLDEHTRMNWLLVVAMSISPVLMLMFHKKNCVEFKFIVFLLLFVFVGFIVHNAPRWTTIAFTCAYILYFIGFTRVIETSKPSIEYYSIVLKVLLIAYCVVLMIQQVCVLLGLPIFNISNYDPLDPWKLNSLMSEPSHSARIVPLLMYLYVLCQKEVYAVTTLKESFKCDKIVWFSFLWSVVTMGSTTGLFFLLIVIAKFMTVKDLRGVIVGGFLVVGALSYFSESKVVTRFKNVITATITLDEDKIIEADHSASFRIVPTIQGAKAVGFFSVDDILGHGIDADTKAIPPLPTVENGSAGAFSMWFNCGWVIAIFFWIISFKICYIKRDVASLLAWFLCVWIVGGLNNQILWLTIVLIYTYKRLCAIYV